MKARWYVDCRSTILKEGKVYGDLAKYDTYQARYTAANKLLRKLRNKVKKNRNRLLFEKVDTYFDSRAHILALKTYQTYSSKWGLIKEYFYDKDITKETLSVFFEQHILIDKKLAKTTYNHYLVFMRMVLDVVGKKDLLKGFKKLKATPTPATFFNRMQAAFLIKKLEEENNTIAMSAKIMCYCSLRNGKELRFLKVGDIFPDEAYIRVESEDSKNGKRRFAAIPDVYLEELTHYIIGRNPNEYLIYNRNDPFSPVSSTYLTAKHNKIARSYGFTKGKYTLYSWRHTGAYLAYTAGASIKEIQIQFGHHCISQTDQYLRQLGIKDLNNYRAVFPSIS